MERETCFAAAVNPRPLFSSILVRYCERGLRIGELLRRGEGGLHSGEPVTFVMLPFRHFCFCSVFLSFSFPFDSNIAIFYRII